MSTTTLRLPDELKARIAEAAKYSGTTPHRFMLEAVAKKTAQAEQRAKFDALAEERYARILETGNTLDWVEVRDYLQARTTGQTALQPKAHGRGNSDQPGLDSISSGMIESLRDSDSDRVTASGNSCSPTMQLRPQPLAV